MIVPMRKTFVVVRREDRDRLLELLRELGAVHLVPVDPARAVPDEKALTGIRDAERTVRVLSSITPVGEPPDVPVADIARTVLDLQQRVAERRSELANLKRQLERMKIWALHDPGVDGGAVADQVHGPIPQACHGQTQRREQAVHPEVERRHGAVAQGQKPG